MAWTWTNHAAENRDVDSSPVISDRVTAREPPGAIRCTGACHREIEGSSFSLLVFFGGDLHMVLMHELLYPVDGRAPVAAAECPPHRPILFRFLDDLPK